MKNKKIIICIIVFLVLILGVLLIFKGKDNSSKGTTNNINNSKKNNSINSNEKQQNINPNIFTIVTKSENKIYALTLDGEEIELFDISEYNGGSIYTYINGKLYLYLNKYTDKNTNKSILGYIDLTKEDYEFTKLTDLEIKGTPSSIAVADNKIYFTSSVYDGIYRYNIDTKYLSNANNIEFKEGQIPDLYTISDELIGYAVSSTTNESPSIGIINAKSKTKKEISNNASFEYVYNGNIIYTQYEKNDYSKWTYYEYNINDKSSKQISDLTTSSQSIYESYIVPVDNYYIYVNKNTLYKYDNNTNEKILEFKESIDNINLISKNKINIVYGNIRNNNFKYQTLDLDNLKLNDAENKNTYLQVIYIK